MFLFIYFKYAYPLTIKHFLYIFLFLLIFLISKFSPVFILYYKKHLKLGINLNFPT